MKAEEDKALPVSDFKASPIPMPPTAPAVPSATSVFSPSGCSWTWICGNLGGFFIFFSSFLLAEIMEESKESTCSDERLAAFSGGFEFTACVPLVRLREPSESSSYYTKYSIFTKSWKIFFITQQNYAILH